MAEINNPRKTFHFSILIAGLNPFLAQEVTTPDVDTEQVHHGDTNFDVKTAGRVKIGNAHINKISTAYLPDNWVWLWHLQCMNTTTGGGLIPALYWRDIIVTEFAIDGRTVINTHTWLNCWPTKINGYEFKRMESANTIEKIELSVERVWHV